MAHVTFRVYSKLNDRLPPDRRQRPMAVDVPDGARLGETLRGLEVDPAEVGLVFVNEQQALMDRPLAEGDRVAAYPPLVQLGGCE